VNGGQRTADGVGKVKAEHSRARRAHGAPSESAHGASASAPRAFDPVPLSAVRCPPVTSRSAARRAPLIELAHCSLILDGHAVLDDVSFALRRGERWALVGPNGSGKTMLLKMLRGDVWPTPAAQESANVAGAGMRRSGRRYRFGGQVSREPGGLKHYIAYVGSERQDKYVRYGWNFSVVQVVTTGLFDEDIPLTSPSRAQRERVARLLRRFGLWALRSRRMLALSYGQRRLALVARVFASEAQVLLLDEVFNGLDARARDKLRRALERPRGGHEWVLASHRPKELPANVTHVARIEAGRIVEKGAGLAARGSQEDAGFGARDAGQKRGAPKEPLSASDPRPEPRASSPLLVIRNASFYRDYRPIIRALNWTIRRGEHWAVLGANGSGKSTLLSAIHGDLHPALGGSIERAGLPRGARIEEWKRRVGWVSPELQADHHLAKSLEEIVISGRYASIGLNEPPTKTDRSVARRWLRFFHIDHLRKRAPRQASYGQMRLALIARAMANDPELLLLDEPCTGLDADIRADVLALIEQLARRGTQLIMAVHDYEDIVPAVTKILRIGRGGEAGLGTRGSGRGPE
jgi:molybdate transport system ATP-binding protein